MRRGRILSQIAPTTKWPPTRSSKWLLERKSRQGPSRSFQSHSHSSGTGSRLSWSRKTELAALTAQELTCFWEALRGASYRKTPPSFASWLRASRRGSREMNSRSTLTKMMFKICSNLILLRVAGERASLKTLPSSSNHSGDPS